MKFSHEASWRRAWLAILGIAFCLTNWGCSRTRPDEEVLAGIIDTLAVLAEEKDLEAMMAVFSEDFRDFEGRTKSGLRSLLNGYLTGRTAIVVHRLSTKVEALDADAAVLETEVAVSSGRAEAVRRLVRISPDMYRIRLECVRGGEGWLIQYAAWSSVELTDLFPESLSILKKIFPGLLQTLSAPSAAE